MYLNPPYDRILCAQNKGEETAKHTIKLTQEEKWDITCETIKEMGAMETYRQNLHDALRWALPFSGLGAIVTYIIIQF